MNITVIGAGAWGTALAINLAERHRVTLFARDSLQIAAMQKTRCNAHYLPEVLFPDSLALTADFSVSLLGAELIILAVPSAALRPTLQRLVDTGTHLSGVIWLCKGFEAQSSLLPHQVAAEVLPQHVPCGVLSGPSCALEVARGLPTALVLAAGEDAFAQDIAQSLHHSRLRVYASSDVVGVEVGGAVKNVMAIASGVCEGLQLGNNARAALITRGLAEIARLGLKLGGHQETLSGLSGAGDLILTCTGELSRNRRVGLMLAKNLSLDAILGQLGHVAEGVYAAREVYHLAQRVGVDMPISTAVYRVLYENIPAAEMAANLLNRSASLEFSLPD